MGGISKNKIRKTLKSLFRVRSWKLLLILLPLLFLTATLLRYEHLGMVKLRDEVLAVDKNGSEEEIKGALSKLQEYTFSHIIVNMSEENGAARVTFGTGTFYLENQYTKKAKEELARAEAALGNSDDNPNGNVFKKAAEVCDVIGKQKGWNYNKAYFDCIFTELDKYPATGEINTYQEAMLPSTILYRHNYASPIWAPTWAGFMIILCLLMCVVIFMRFLIWLTLRASLIFIK